MTSHQSLLSSFLSKFKTIKGSSYTHTSIGNPKSAYYIPAIHEDTFHDLYSKVIEEGCDIYLTEKHRDKSPILIDFDFKFKRNDLSRNYNLDHIKLLIRIYIEECLNFVKIDQNKSSIKIYLLEKTSPVFVKNDLVKDGFHIIIPSIVTKPTIQFMIRENILDKLDKELKFKIFYDNDIQDVFDEAVIQRNNWQMYGSKKPECEDYKVSHVFEYNVETKSLLDVDNTLSCYETIIELSIRNKYFDLEIHESKLQEVLDRETKQKEILDKKTSTSNIIQHYKNSQTFSCENLEIIKEFVAILDKKRASNYYDWIRVGWCLRNIDDSLLDDWITFSKKSSQFIDGECEKLWPYMKSGIGVGSLHMWCKHDNLEEYTNIKSKDISQVIHTSLNDALDYDVAVVIYRMFEQEFRCVSIKNGSWFEFKNHRWCKTEKAYSLRNKISTLVYDEYLKKHKYWSNRKIEAVDNGEENQFETYAKSAKKIAKLMKNTTHKEKMIKEVSDKFRSISENFENRLDSIPTLIGFNNGVYDLRNLEFREGRPEDLISFSTHIDYVEYSPENKYYSDIMNFIDSVLPKEDVKEYVLTLLASFLDGANKDEKFHIWTGTGSNGKSKLIELYQNTIGDYYCQFNVSLLTSKRVASNSTNSELVKGKGKRFAVLQEPDENERINIGLMKEMTGGDTIVCRGLYQEPIEFKPMFKMVLTCNHMPALPPNDKATWRRVRRVKFESEFVDDPQPDKPNQYLKDRTLSFKFSNWKECFMGILIEYYKIYKENGIIDPPAVTEATTEYQKKQDIFVQFIDESVVPETNCKMYLKDVFDTYKLWLSSQGLRGQVTLREFQENIENKINQKAIKPPQKQAFWKNFKLVQSDVNDEAEKKDEEY